MSIKSLIIKNWSIIFVTIFFFICLLYVLIRGENMYIMVHDNLDGYVPHFKYLSDNSLWWAPQGTMLNIFGGGIERNYFSSDLNVYSWLYMIMPTFPAYISGLFIKAIMSIVGMCFLGKVILSDYDKKRNLVIICGFLFGLTPTYPTAAIAFASLPFIFGLLILLYKKPKWFYFPLVFLYPFISNFVFLGLFLCGFVLIFFVIDLIARRRPKWVMLIAFGLLSAGFIVTEWRLFNIFLFNPQDTIRDGLSGSFLPLSGAIKEMFVSFFRGMYHAGDNHTYVVLPVCIIYLIWLNVRYIRKKEIKSLFKDPANWIMGWMIFNCIIYGLDMWRPFKQAFSMVFPPLAGFGLGRAMFVNAFLWYFLFMIVLCRLYENRKRFMYELCGLAFVFLLLGPDMYNPFIFTGLNEAMRYIGYEYPGLNWKEFYAENLFDKIKKDIDYNGERAVAYGFHPAVLEYNGISAIDGYLSYLPQGFKDKFKRMIEPSLARSEFYADYFNGWGGRAYIFSEEVDYAPVRDIGVTEGNLYINADVLREFDGKYVFSRVKILNAEELGIKEIGVYTDQENTPVKMHVYEVEGI